LVEIMIVVAIIGLLAAIAIPNFVHARNQAQANACINNLRQIDAAKQQWALETGQQSGASPQATDIQPYLGRGAAGVLPLCPAGGTTSNSFATSYTIDVVSNSPSCKILGSAAGGNHILN
jgi:type II secretory pathway pseudopilin PulG